MQGVITINDPRYPKLLKQIGKDAPKQLYYKGNWPVSPPASPARRGESQGGDEDIFEN